VVFFKKIKKGLYTFKVLYYIMCFEYEIPYGVKSKKSNVTNEEDIEIEPKLEKAEEQVTVSAI
jgi:hypothetical protein